MTGLFSVILGLVGAYLTGFVNPYVCFSGIGVFGLVVFASAFKLTRKLEIEGDISADAQRTFSQEVKHNW